MLQVAVFAAGPGVLRVNVQISMKTHRGILPEGLQLDRRGHTGIRLDPVHVAVNDSRDIGGGVGCRRATWSWR
jgi:hypothetical protein